MQRFRRMHPPLDSSNARTTSASNDRAMPTILFPRPIGRRGLPLAILWLTATTTGCQQIDTAAPQRTVLAAPAARANQLHTQLHGWVRPRVESRLSFQVPGKLNERFAEVGMVVETGQVIASLDTSDLRVVAAARSAQVASASAKARFSIAELTRARALAAKGLLAAGALASHEADAAAASAALLAAEKELESANLAIQHATLKADTAGVVTAVYAEPGEVLGTGTPVVAVASDAQREVELLVPEALLGHFEPGAIVEVMTSPAAQPLAGRVREQSPAADGVFAAFRVRISLPVELVDGPRIGSKAAVAVSERTEGFVVPNTAVVSHDSSSTAVWQIDQLGIVHAREVQVQRMDQTTSVVTGNLDTAHPVVAIGAHLLREGETVRVVDASFNEHLQGGQPL